MASGSTGTGTGTGDGDIDDRAEKLEVVLRAIPLHSALAGEQEDRFRGLRLRIGRRQADWRRNMGSLAPLFDDDAHCAKALAGNLATELGEILTVWSRIQAENGPFSEGELQPILTWIDDVVARWRSQARSYAVLEGWTGEAKEVFDGFLGELSERAAAGAAEKLRNVAPTAGNGAPGGGIVGRFIGVLVGGVRRFFHPRPPESQ